MAAGGAYNQIVGSNGMYGRTRTIRGLLNSGADLMKNMYDVKIYFPNAEGNPESETSLNTYPITVRATSFKVPDVEVSTYPVKYHGIEIERPKTEMTFKRQFDLEFREDAALELRRKFTAWFMATADPVTGGVSNATSWFGRVEVGTIVGEYWASTLAPGFKTAGGQLTTDLVENENSILASDGHITSNINPLAFWAFYNVWINKITGVEFQTESGEPNKFTVTFNFMDFDAPQFGGNRLDVGVTGW